MRFEGSPIRGVLYYTVIPATARQIGAGRATVNMSSGQFPFISLISVTWNARECTVEWLNHLSRIEYPRERIEIIIHDNVSGDGSVDAFRAKFQEMAHDGWRRLEVLASDKDLCACGGLDRAIRACSPDSEFFFRLDNDAYPEANALHRMLDIFAADPKVGVVGCKILYFDPPHAVNAAAFRMNWWTGSSRMIDATGATESDTLLGAAMLVKRALVEKVGYLADPSFFIMCEEADLCHKARALGFKAVYTPDAIVYHKTRISTGRRPNPIQFLHSRNSILFVRRHAPSRLQRWLCMARYTLNAAKLAFTCGETYRLRGALSGLMGLAFSQSDWERLCGR